MKYITYNEMSSMVRRNFYKVPHDIDVVVGIPRSGMLVAGIIAEFLNKPLVDIDNYINGCFNGVGGGRLRHNKNKPKYNKVLVVDDTVFYGTAKKGAVNKLQTINSDCEYIFLAAYLEGPAANSIDIYLEDVRQYTNGFREPVIYEWNVFHHNESIMEHCIYDMDGVLCVEPPDERNTKQYEEYIANAIPLFCPSTKIGAIQTFRLVKYRDITEKWLKEHNIEYNHLLMFNADSWDERNNTRISSEQYKALYYSAADWAKLFVESSDYQARVIHQLTNKAVLSIEGNCLYS